MTDEQTSFLDPEEAALVAKESGDRQRNTLATPAFLASLVTCCVCGGDLSSGRRYQCPNCER